METRSQWEDSGYDCTYCGGQIFKRTDIEPTGVHKSYFQCELCGAQWALNHALIREGERSKRRTPPPAKGKRRPLANLPGWGWLLLGSALVFLLLRASVIGALLVRFLIPVLFVGIVSFVLYRLGREMEWW